MIEFSKSPRESSKINLNALILKINKEKPSKTIYCEKKEFFSFHTNTSKLKKTNKDYFLLEKTQLESHKLLKKDVFKQISNLKKLRSEYDKIIKGNESDFFQINYQLKLFVKLSIKFYDRFEKNPFEEKSIFNDLLHLEEQFLLYLISIVNNKKVQEKLEKIEKNEIIEKNENKQTSKTLISNDNPNYLIFENVKQTSVIKHLKFELDKLSMELNDKKDQTKINELESNNLEKIKKIEIENFTLKNQINIIKHQLFDLKALNTSINQKEKELNIQNIELKKENNELKKIKIENKRLNEIISMQFEEINSLKIEKNKTGSNLTSVAQKIKSLVKKFTYSNSIENNSINLNVDKNTINEIKLILISEFHKNLNEEIHFDSKNFEKVDLSKYVYLKPTFYGLFSHEIFEQKKIFNLSPVDHQYFLITIRGIFDSKYNEFILYDNYSQYTDFSDFVFSWLSNFYISMDKLCVIHIFDREEEKIESLRHKFLSILVYFGKSWEVFTFREFLETGNLDEIYFYLYCRNLIFRGPQLQRRNSFFDYIDYVDFNLISHIISIIFVKYDKESQVFLLKRLKEKIVSNNLIDSSFVLHIFLEYYRLDRKLAFKQLEHALLTVPLKRVNGQYCLRNFKSFEQLFNKIYPNTQTIEKIKIYKECYNISKGNISIEILFTVLNESKFLIKTLNLGNFNEIDYNSKNNIFDEYRVILNFIQNQLKIKEKEINVILNLCGKIGVENYYEEFIKIQEILCEKNARLDLKQFKGKNIFFLFSNLCSFLLEIRNLDSFYKNCGRKNIEINKIKSDFIELNFIFVVLQKLEKEEKLKEFEIIRSTKKIQNHIRRKLNKWYTLFKQLISK